MSEVRQPRKDTRSVLRKVFDTAEQAVATRAEPLAQSGKFASALSRYVSVNRKLTGVLGKATGGVLHLVNIPTTRDVSKLHQHLSTVDSHLAELLREIDRNSGGDGIGRSVAREQPRDSEIITPSGSENDAAASVDPRAGSRAGTKASGQGSHKES